MSLHKYPMTLSKLNLIASPTRMQTRPQVEQINKPAMQLPQELWTHILKHVSYVELWYACRLVSRTFHKDSNFILRTQYISQEVGIIAQGSYMSFSHFDAANMAYFEPCEMLTPFCDIITKLAMRGRELARLYKKEPLVIMQLPRTNKPNKCRPETDLHAQDIFSRAYLWADRDRTVVKIGNECVGVDWQELCAKYMARWNSEELQGWTRRQQGKAMQIQDLVRREERDEKARIRLECAHGKSRGGREDAIRISMRHQSRWLISTKLSVDTD